MNIGFLDDEYSIFDGAKNSFAEYGMELIKLDDIQNLSDYSELINTLFDKKLDYLFVDYDLRRLSPGNIKGTTVVSNLFELVPDFPMGLLTSYVDAGEREFIIPKKNIISKDIFQEEDDSLEFKNFINCIKNEINCFHKKMEIVTKSYKDLLQKKRTAGLSETENSQFIRLYKKLEVYQEIDPLPDGVLDNSFQDLIKKMKKTLSDLSEELERE